MDYKITLSDLADEQVRKAIAAPLIRYNEALAGPSQHRPLVLAIRDSSGAVIGGLWGATAYGWLYTQMLTVPESLRGQGVGTQLMQQAEEEARQRGCRQAWVDTQFGARPFYEKLGYSVFGELPDYPPGIIRIFLRKSL
jgi:GNAT superfamily N-acetyltransferase